jgi:ribosomal protein S18 acetylase RimI-like enzyme
MMLINDQVTQGQLKQLEELINACKDVDPGLPNIYRQLMIEPRSKGANILYYMHGSLVGFLSAYYFFYDACELTLLVHPKFRRQGIAKKMLKSMHQLFIERSVIRVVFSRFPDEHDSWLRHLGLTYHHSEYSMSYDMENLYEISASDLVIEEAVATDIPIMEELDKKCFPNVNNKVPADFYQVFYDPEYTVFMARLQGVTVGKTHIRWGDGNGFLSDIAVDPEYQGQGVGTNLVKFCANKIFASKRPKVLLDVVSKNTGALNIYTKHGFKVISQRDYWEYLIAGLTKFCFE